MTAPIVNLLKADEKTAFILGNGPSLRGVSLPALSSFATIGLNAAYRYWREINWRPTYYACLDLVVGLSHREAIAALIAERRIEKFLLRTNLIDALGETARDRRIVNFDAALARLPILRAGADVTTGTHAALWAATLGFRRLVILGVDGRYTEMVAGADRRDGIELEIVGKGDNPNYFFDDYQQPGDRYNLPNPRANLHLDAWRDAACALGQAGVEVYNANPHSAVRYFPFIDLAALLSGGGAPVPADAPMSGETTGAPIGEAIRFGASLRRRPFLVSAPAMLIAAGLAALLAVQQSAMATAAAFAGGVFLYGLFFLGLYMRHTATQIGRLQSEVNMLRTEIEDRERLSGADDKEIS